MKNWEVKTVLSASEIEKGDIVLFLMDVKGNSNLVKLIGGEVVSKNEHGVCSMNKRGVPDFYRKFKSSLKNKLEEEYTENAIPIGGPGKVVVEGSKYIVKSEIKEREREKKPEEDIEVTKTENKSITEIFDRGEERLDNLLRNGNQLMEERNKLKQKRRDTIIEVRFCPRKAKKGFYNPELDDQKTGRETEIVKKIKGKAPLIVWLPYVIEDFEKRKNSVTGLIDSDLSISLNNNEDIFAFLTPLSNEIEKGKAQKIYTEDNEYILNVSPEFSNYLRYLI